MNGGGPELPGTINGPGVGHPGTPTPRGTGLSSVTATLSRELHPGSRLVLNGLLLVLALGTMLFWFWAYLVASNVSTDRVHLFNDATTYLAAAERLNVGHDLYALREGDRPVLRIPGVYDAPLLSPPPIAASWRLLAATPIGFPLWMIAAWAATLAAVAYVVLKAPFPGAPLAFLLSLPLGEQVFGGNACAFYPLLYILAWKYRGRAWIGIPIAAMAAVKLAPIALAAWLVGTRQYRALAVTFVTLAILFVMGGIGAGFGSYVEYLGMLSGVGQSPLSVSGLTGIAWASYAVLGVGSVAAIVVGRRSTAGSYTLALLAAVFGTPALYPGHLASLLALAAPFADPGNQPSGRSRWWSPSGVGTKRAAHA
jgi:hypothetical protein